MSSTTRSKATRLHELAAWLATLQIRQLDELAAQHAVDELVTDAVEHAYHDIGAVAILPIRGAR